MNERPQVTAALQEIAGPSFSVQAEGCGYTAKGEPTPINGLALYRWAVRVAGCHDEDDIDMLRALKPQLEAQGFMATLEKREKPGPVLLVNERASFPEHYAIPLGPPPEDGLVAVNDQGGKFVCWCGVLSEEFRWYPAGLKRRPMGEDEEMGYAWDALLYHFGPLAVTGYEQATVEFSTDYERA